MKVLLFMYFSILREITYLQDFCSAWALMKYQQVCIFKTASHRKFTHKHHHYFHAQYLHIVIHVQCK